MARVRLHEVCKLFRGVTAVSSLSLDIADGELLVLVGPSGCGKTTALRMVAGLEAVTSGEVHIGDRQVNELSPKDRDVAMVFQSYALYPHMTVRQNLEFGLRMRRMPAAEITARVQAVAEMLDLQGLLDRFPRAMSGGQRQRVAMGRAIVRRPALFLFDEPLSNLDAKLRARMRTELARLHAQLRTTSIYVTHDQVEAMTLADRIAVMKDGVLQQVGTPLELYGKPANRFVAGFIGTPAMNFVDGELLGEEGAPAFVADGLRFALPPELAAALGERSSQARVALGIRPSDIRICEPQDTDEGGGDDEVAIAATVEVCEPLGAESYLHVATPCGPLVARVESRAAVGAGHRVTICLPRARLHFFDGVNDASLGC